ncbi:MAG: cyclase family protein, partial [Campylobacterales bacterium]|nr:cyclase family protein [Campylobacterales bacterium]
MLIKIKATPNYVITKNDILKFEKRNGKIPQRSIVVFATGWNNSLK